MTNLSELREKAERATGGQWEYDDSDPTRPPAIVVREIDADDRGRAVHFKDEIATVADTMDDEANAAYIVAAQPQVVIGMIDELEAKDRRIEALMKALEDLEARCEHVAATRSRKAYLQMVEDGQSEALIALDASRRAARSTLTGEKK